MLQGALNRKDDQKLVSGFSHFYHNNLFLGILAIGYFFIVSTLSIPARLLLRKKFGERSISIPSFLLVYVVYTYLILILFIIFVHSNNYGLYLRMQESSWVSIQSWPRFLFNLLLFLASPFLIFMILMVRRGILHFRYHLIRARNKVIGYSFYRGEGLFFNHRRGGKIFGFEINETILRMVVEPLELVKISSLLLVLSIVALIFRSFYPEGGVFFIFLDDITFGILSISLILIISSIALFLEEFAIMQKGRDAILDMVDVELDMERILAIKNKLQIELPENSDNQSI